MHNIVISVVDNRLSDIIWDNGVENVNQRRKVVQEVIGDAVAVTVTGIS